MSSSRLAERLRGSTREAMARYGSHRAEAEERRGQPPRPGEIFALAETAELGILWIVLDAEARRLVAADVHPAVGSTDVALPEEAACGVLTLRSAIEVRLGEDAFASATRVGFVESEVLERVRRKQAEITAGTLRGSELERETDLEPEYRYWIEELTEARDRLAARWERQEPAARVLGFPSPLPRRQVYALAASLLVGVALGLVGSFFWHPGTHEEDANLAFRLLHPKEERQHEIDDGDVLYLPEVAEAFILVLFVEAQYPEYRLEIRESGTDRLAWSRAGLERIRSEPIPGSEAINVVLDRRELAPGDYWLVLYGLEDSREERVAEYGLRVREGG